MAEAQRKSGHDSERGGDADDARIRCPECGGRVDPRRAVLAEPGLFHPGCYEETSPEGGPSGSG